MSTIRDQLNKHFDKADEDGGLSTLALLNLPKAVNRVIRVFLRNKQITYDDLQKAIAEMPEDSRLSKEDLDEMIAVLMEREWLEKSEFDGKTAYGINLRPTSMSPSAKREATDEIGKGKTPELTKTEKSVKPETNDKAKDAETATISPTVKINKKESKAEPDKKTGKATPAHAAETVPSITALSKDDIKKRLAEKKAEGDKKEEKKEETPQEVIRRKGQTGELKAGDLWDALDL